MSFDGRLIITPPPRKTKQITDVVQWAQAFSIFSLVLVTWFPHRARDLLLYELLILRTYSQFGRGDARRNYDEAFRRDAAARGLSDWSNMNVELFNIHTAAVRVPRSPSRVQHAGSSTPSSSFFCRSWNSGSCTAFGRQCIYRHACDRLACGGSHRRIFCPFNVAAETTQSHTARGHRKRFSFFLKTLICLFFLLRCRFSAVRYLFSVASVVLFVNFTRQHHCFSGLIELSCG